MPISMSNAGTSTILALFMNTTFLKDTNGFLANKVKVNVKKGKHFSLVSTLTGEKIDRERHELRNDLKAITMHMFEVKQVGKKWKATIVVDI